ncbi:MAG: ACP S-malonyltransferase, partial [Steroidobacter sp.]
RGQAMQQAVPAGQGAMAAILGLDDAEVETACREAAQGEIVQAVNFNSPGQVVIAGAAAAVDRAIEVLKTKGAKRSIKLPVSAPSHCPLMNPAADRLSERLQKIDIDGAKARTVYNVDVRKHGADDEVRRALVKQLVEPVRWSETIRAIVAEGARVIVECGPGRVLTGLNRRIEKNKEITMLAVEDSASLAQALEACRSNSR